MTPIKRPLAAAGAAVLLALSLTACGGGAPTDASVEDFCKIADNTGNEEFFNALEKKDYDKLEDLLKDHAKDAEETGTPEDIPDDAREGFEIQLDAYQDIDADDLKEAFEAEEGEDPFEDDFSKEEKEKVEAFTEYQNETCAGSTGSDSGEEPSVDVPTDVPTDLPTDVPSDLPTSPEDLESLLSDLPSNLPSDLESLLSDLPTQ